MIRSGAITAIRTSTGHDSDTQVTDTQLGVWIDQIYPEFRREILDVAPSLYTAVAATQDLTTTDPDFDLPADFERVSTLQVLCGVDYLGVPPVSDVSPDFGGLCWREEAGVLRLAPATSCTGTYRLAYNKAPTLTGDYTIEVPTGCELVIVERVAAMVRVRFNEDPTPHLATADRIWHGAPGMPGSGQKTAIRRRFGGHTQGGFVQTRAW